MSSKDSFEKLTVKLSDLNSQSEIQSALIDSFSCPQGMDVEKFLKKNAVRFENSHNSRTYLILDKNNLKQLLAYFSVSFKEISLPESLSRREIQKIDGISRDATTARAFLIGQIAKNSFQGNPINLASIFEEVYSVLYRAQDLVGGRILFLECEDHPKLINMYESNGFKVLQKKEMVEMYRIFNLV